MVDNFFTVLVCTKMRLTDHPNEVLLNLIQFNFNLFNSIQFNTLKGYLCYKRITSQNLSSETQIKNFFIS